VPKHTAGGLLLIRWSSWTRLTWTLHNIWSVSDAAPVAQQQLLGGIRAAAAAAGLTRCCAAALNIAVAHSTTIIGLAVCRVDIAAFCTTSSRLAIVSTEKGPGRALLPVCITRSGTHRQTRYSVATKPICDACLATHSVVVLVTD